MFNDMVVKFKALPNSMKNGILFLFVAWMWYYMSLYTNLLKGEIPPRQFAIGLSICFLIVMMIYKKNWARALCILCNIFIVVQFLPVSIEFFNRGEFKFGTVSGLIVLFFSISAYFLLIKESSSFFKKDEPEADKVPDRV